MALQPKSDDSVDTDPPNHNDTARYVIFLKDMENFEQAKAVRALLGLLVADQSQIYVPKSTTFTIFLAAPLTPDDAAIVDADPNVGSNICS